MTRLTASVLNSNDEYAHLLLARLSDRDKSGLEILGAKPEILVEYDKPASGRGKGKSVRFDVVCVYRVDGDPMIHVLIVEGKCGARQNDYDGKTQTELYCKLCDRQDGALLRDAARQTYPKLADDTPLDWSGTLLTLVKESEDEIFDFRQCRFEDLDPDGRLGELAQKGESLDEKLLCALIDLYCHDTVGSWLKRINEVWDDDGTARHFAETYTQLCDNTELDDKTKSMLERLCIHAYGTMTEKLLRKELRQREPETWHVGDARDRKPFQMYLNRLHGPWIVEKLPGNPNVGAVALKTIVESQLIRTSGKVHLSIQLDSDIQPEEVAPALQGVDMAEYKSAGKMTTTEWNAYLKWHSAVYPRTREILKKRLLDLLNDGHKDDPHGWTLRENRKLPSTDKDKRVAQLAAIEFYPGGDPQWATKPYKKVMEQFADDLVGIRKALDTIIAETWPDREKSWTK
ncbi:hypothetical protein [Bifidobacterium vansinderenii]|uniref:hypothetical protein n=1 Tax=Bifidobacterium vansinderenii TaxID=1984871 RepID=UPI0011777320|nr:hypothetical protein [Bifidobacterium vansinderenii]